MQDLSLLISVAMLLVTAFIGGLAARRLGLPSIVGYLMAGMAIGPFTPGFLGDQAQLTAMDELFGAGEAGTVKTVAPVV